MVFANMVLIKDHSLVFFPSIFPLHTIFVTHDIFHYWLMPQRKGD